MKCKQVHRAQGKNPNEKKTLIVIIITVIMMIAEISGGLVYGSIALLSDGIHMGTHTLALLITLGAYIISKRNALNEKFTFGTGKIGVLGGYSSAIILIIAALVMAWEAIERFIEPVDISFNQSILVAIIGLVVNLVSAYLLFDSPHHHHDHDDVHGHHHHHHHEDHNLKAAYLHVVADALTSVLAIVALFAGKYWGALWLDPLVGIAGAIVVVKWGYGLLKSTGAILLDYEPDRHIYSKVRELVEDDNGVNVADIHIWKIASGERVMICSINGQEDQNKRESLRKKISTMGEFTHTTVEFVTQ